MYRNTILALTFGLCGLGHFNVLCTCPPDGVVDYVTIPEEQYDRNYSSISSIGKRPLGFDKATWYYNQPGASNPCIKISGASQRRIEIMFETHPRSRLCVKDQVSEEECSDAGTGSLYVCRPAPADDVYLEFYCDQGEEYDVRFWYRLVLGELPAEDNEDLWCDSRQREDYPASLLQLPSNFPMSRTTTADPGAGFALQPCSLLIFAWAVLVMLVL
ncbi:hypothetical protein PoB_004216100 [Plakobranchus ocellatus]|uniref:Uncharacterized protein n=1 Tax=Plakobranchus ocellatus TaxID=259542 RepID=A0AAV4AX18_9GAST|nr:hypothetical protein PoB_004216100 [Plakobranchus ocellatus]